MPTNHSFADVSGFFASRLFRPMLSLLLGITLSVSTASAALSVKSAALPVAMAGSVYSVTLTATGGTAPYTWNLQSGGFPSGISLSSAGVISGRPTGATWEYSYPFSAYIRVTDSTGQTSAGSFTMKLVPPLAITTTTLPAATAGTPYAQTLVATGGLAPYTWTLSAGGFPDSLAIDSAGNITGTVLAGGSWIYSYPFQVYITVTDAASNTTAASYTISVLPPVSATTYALTVVNGTGGGSFAANATVTVTANAAPAGQVFQNWIGAVFADASATTTTLTMPSADTTVTANYVAVSPPPPPPPAPTPLAITAMTLPAATAGTPYTQTLAATGGTPPYTWTLSSGGFPDGLTLDSAGNITGTALDEGSWIYNYPFQMYITVTDAASKTAAASFSMSVLPPAGGSVPPPPPPPPPATNYTVTVTNGTANGVASGSFAPGTTVTLVAAAAPAGQYFQQWTGNAPVASSLASTTTFAMPSMDVTVAASYYTPAPIPQPVATHPRLWLTPADLPKYQSWATASNPIYQQGMLPLLNRAMSDYDNQFFPGGQPNPVYPDIGDTQGYQGLITEQYALIFALNSLIDPSPANRILFAQRARNLIMYALNQAALGPQSGAPFRDPLFVTYNRGNATSEAWPLVVDWIYNATDAQGNPILTASDKLTIRNVFLQWAGACLNASTTGGDHPSPVGVANSNLLLPGGNAYRMASNNYYLGHARLVTLMSLAIDPADDPAVDPTIAPSILGNSLRSYITNATGAWLYQEYAMLGDPNTVRAAYGLGANASVGLASGGLPPEGMLYGHSYSYILGQLLAIKTAGFADPTLSGPQVALANNAPLWDRFMRGMATSIVPASQVYPGYAYMGPVYEVASYGDILRMWITPDFAQPMALLALLDQQNGDTSRLNAERWWVTNALEGGPGNLINRVANPWSYGVQDALLTFLLLDPTAPAATDPRPNYPTAFYDASQGRLVEHTDWTPNASMFDFRCSWISINHQQADANQFEFFRQGEWLTKGVANYDNNSFGLTTDYHNTLSLQNWCQNGTPTNLGWWEGPFWTRGSQWQLGGSAGDPSATVSVQAGYTYVYGDTTNLYNRPSQWTPANAALDIVHASRSILWLKPDHIVVYDRATSKTAGLFKRFNLALTATPTVNGNVVTTTTPHGQHLYVTNLLPAGATITTYPVGPELNPIAQLEPATSRIAIETSANLTDVRFLHVLQGADASQTVDPTALVQSTAGTTFDGALVLDTVVMFKHDIAAAFTGVSYTVPATTTHHYVTDLAPNTGYTVTLTPNGSSVDVTVAPGGATMTDSAGVLAF